MPEHASRRRATRRNIEAGQTGLWDVIGDPFRQALDPQFQWHAGVATALFGAKKPQMVEDLHGWIKDIPEKAQLATTGKNIYTDPFTDSYRAAYSLTPEEAAVDLTLALGLTSSIAGAARGTGVHKGVLKSLLGGEKSATAPTSLLEQARQLRAAGVPEDQIWSQTGWMWGKDHMPRYEIPSTNMRLREEALVPRTTTTQKFVRDPSDPALSGFRDISTTSKMKVGKLEYVIEWPEAFQAYPELKDYQVNIKLGGERQRILQDKGWEGEFDPLNKKITVWGKDAESARSTLIHELNHGVQEIEAFSKGGNLRTKDQYIQHWTDLKQDAQSIRALVKEDLLKSGVTPGEHEALTKWAKKAEATIKKAEERISQANQYTAREFYTRLYGEQEARAMQARDNYIQSLKETGKSPEEIDKALRDYSPAEFLDDADGVSFIWMPGQIKE